VPLLSCYYHYPEAPMYRTKTKPCFYCR
jgi:hypothetical protein